MLYMLTAYDKQPSVDLLDAARQLCEWQQEHPDLMPDNITALNRLQIIRRERMLTFAEKGELYAIATTSADPFHRIGAFLLLDEQEEATAVLETLNEQELNRFKDFPIFKFYNTSEVGENNGETENALGE